MRVKIQIRGAVVASVISAVAASAQAATVCIEAESAGELVEPMAAVTQATDVAENDILTKASGHAYLQIKEGAGKPPKVGGSATIKFTVPKDDSYYLWCRVWWTDGCGNSIDFQIDDTKSFAFGQDSTYKCWHWVKAPPRLPQLKLKAGEHTLTLKNREDGIRIDQILLTTNRRFVPVAVEPVTDSTGEK